MSITPDRESKKVLLSLARKHGKKPTEVLRELVHEAAAARKARGKRGPLTIQTSDPAGEASRTALGRRLRALSRRYVERGGKLLTREEINSEVGQNRGER